MDYLRWILLLLGCLVLLLVYLISRSLRAAKNDASVVYDDSPVFDDLDEIPQPQNSPVAISDSDARSHVLSNISHELETINALLGSKETKSEDLAEPAESLISTLEFDEPSLPEEEVMGDLFADLEDEGPKVADNTQPEKIITLHICARNNEQIPGAKLKRIFNERNYEFGEMDIFHSRFDGVTVFSIVNMLEPGSFDHASMDEFFTPGISLFLRLPGPLAADVAFDVLLNEAREIATQLDAVILDASRSTLTLQMEQHIHEELKQFDFKQKRSSTF
jgi:cell division protein ZipA